MFRFKIALLSVLIAGLLVAGFGAFFLATISRVGMARIDDEIRAFGEAQLRGQHPLDHWAGFDRSLQFIYGDERADHIAVQVRDARGDTLFESEHWPKEFAAIPVPTLAFGEHPPRPGPREPGPLPPGRESDEGAAYTAARFVDRLDSDGDGRVSGEEFDGPAEHFHEFDEDADGYVTRSEAPRWRPGRPPPRRPGPGDNPRPMPARMKEAVFETHPAARGQWRMGFMGNQFVTLIVAADLAGLHRETGFFRKAFLVVVPLALLALAAAGWFLASRAMRPVAVITRTAEAITVRGLDTRVPVANADAELARLVTVINNMLDGLERSFHQASRFSADAAHELQTPLTVLQGELDNAVQHAAAGSEEQQRYSGLLEEVRGLKAVVQKLLLLARADVGRLSLNREEVDLSALVESAVEDVETMAPQLTVETDIAPGVRVQADADLVGQVVRNMTSNAMKYTGESGTIRFRLSADGDKVSFSLANTGPPIPQDDRERVFDRFHRVDRARSRKVRGSGLGLSLAREIARAHGGDLVLEPDRDGMICFALTLPQ